MILERSTRLAEARRKKAAFAADLERQIHARNAARGSPDRFGAGGGGFAGFSGLGERRSPPPGRRPAPMMAPYPPIAAPRSGPASGAPAPSFSMPYGYPGQPQQQQQQQQPHFEPSQPSRDHLQARAWERSQFAGHSYGAGIVEKDFETQVRQEAPGSGRKLSRDDKARFVVQKAKQQAYLDDLNSQIAAKNARKQREKEERLARERREEAEAANYNPWGKPGAGAPMRDPAGHIIADLRDARVQGGSPTRGMGGGGATPAPPPRRSMDSHPAQHTAHGRGYSTPVPPPNEPQTRASSDHTRFQFGQLSPERQAELRSKAAKKMSYQDELKKQIEERKARKAAEKRAREEEDRLELARIERERQQLAEQTRSPRSNAGSPAPPKAAQPPPPQQQQQTRQNEPLSPPPRRQARRFTFEGRDTGMGDAASSVGAGGGGGGGGNLYNPAPPRPSAGAGAGAAGINMHALAGQPFSLPQAPAGTAAAMGFGPGMGMASPMIAGAPGLGLDALARLKRELVGQTDEIRQQLRDQQNVIKELRGQVKLATRERDAVVALHKAITGKPPPITDGRMSAQNSPRSVAHELPSQSSVDVAGSPVRRQNSNQAPPPRSASKTPTTQLGISVSWRVKGQSPASPSPAPPASEHVPGGGARGAAMSSLHQVGFIHKKQEMGRGALDGSLYSKSEFVFDSGLSVPQRHPSRARRSNSLGAAGLQLVSADGQRPDARAQAPLGVMAEVSAGATRPSLSAHDVSDLGRSLLKQHMVGAGGQASLASVRQDGVLARYMNDPGSIAGVGTRATARSLGAPPVVAGGGGGGGGVSGGDRTSDELDNLLSNFVQRRAQWQAPAVM